MTIDAVNDYIYDIAFFMNWGDGTSKDEIEYVIAWAAFQKKRSVAYNRDFGGSFGNLEQQSGNIQQKIAEFQVNLVNSIFMINRDRKFRIFIVVGGDYIIVKQEASKLNVLVMWVLQNDINKMGAIKIK